MEGYLRIRTNRRSFTVQCDSLELGVANFRGPNSEQRAKDCMARIMAVCEDYRQRADEYADEFSASRPKET